MLDNILSMLTGALTSCFNWFTSLLNAIPGSWDLILSMIIVVMVARFILAPLFGFNFGVGSDRARVKDYKVKKENYE